jgi:type VI protein secretion system component VasF
VAAAAALRGRSRRLARRAALWSVVAALVLLGIYFYFAYSRSVTPLRVGG